MKKNYDVIVVGGGFAGITSALSSARNGSKTLLIESLFSLGGLATNGLVCYYLPICDGDGHQVIFSIPFELFLLSMKEGYEEKYPAMWLENRGSKEERAKNRFENKFNPNLFAILAEKLLLENGVEILYGNTLSDVKVIDGKITEIETVSRLDRNVFTAKAFVDASGDAVLSKYAKEQVEVVSNENIPTYWYGVVKNGQYELRLKGGTDYLDGNGSGKKGQYFGVDSQSLTTAMVDYHTNVLCDFLKEGKDTNEYVLTTLSSIPEFRMTQKLVSKEDMKFDDDHVEKVDSLGLFGDWTRRGPIYELTASSMMGKNVGNLFVSGRCLGVDSIRMWNITRVIPTCAVSGEACGVLASEYSKTNKVELTKVQEILKGRGVPLHVKDLNIKD